MGKRNEKGKQKKIREKWKIDEKNKRRKKCKKKDYK